MGEKRLGETWSLLMIEGCGRAEDYSHRHTLTQSDRRFMSQQSTLVSALLLIKHWESFCKTVAIPLQELHNHESPLHDSTVYQQINSMT